MAGNHDIGYGDDMNREWINRFEAAFGAVNRIFKSKSSKLFVSVINTMVLDGTRDTVSQFES
jgi:hypothetical protein